MQYFINVHYNLRSPIGVEIHLRPNPEKTGGRRAGNLLDGRCGVDIGLDGEVGADDNDNFCIFVRGTLQLGQKSQVDLASAISQIKVVVSVTTGYTRNASEIRVDVLARRPAKNNLQVWVIAGCVQQQPIAQHQHILHTDGRDSKQHTQLAQNAAPHTGVCFWWFIQRIFGRESVWAGV